MDNNDAGIPALSIAPGTWGHKKFKLRNKFALLTDSDLQFEPGREEELLIRLGARLGMSGMEVARIIRAL